MIYYLYDEMTNDKDAFYKSLNNVAKTEGILLHKKQISTLTEYLYFIENQPSDTGIILAKPFKSGLDYEVMLKKLPDHFDIEKIKQGNTIFYSKLLHKMCDIIYNSPTINNVVFDFMASNSSIILGKSLHNDGLCVSYQSVLKQQNKQSKANTLYVLNDKNNINYIKNVNKTNILVLFKVDEQTEELLCKCNIHRFGNVVSKQVIENYKLINKEVI